LFSDSDLYELGAYIDPFGISPAIFQKHHRKSDTINKFHSRHLLNPIKHRKLSKNIDIFTKIDIYSDLIQANLGFVVSKWCHDVTWKSGVFFSFLKR